MPLAAFKLMPPCSLLIKSPNGLVVERPPWEREVPRPIPGRVIPKTYKNGTSGFRAWRSAFKRKSLALLSYPRGDGLHQE